MLQLYVRLLYVKLRLLRVTGTSTVLWWLATTVHDFMYQGEVHVLVLLVRVRESGFCWKIWIRFFYGCGGCAVYFVFSTTFLLFQIL